MNFGALLHEGARTRVIISGLTRAIQLLFSIRQGDPIALHHLYRTVASCLGEENDRLTSGKHREEFGSLL